MQGTIFEPLDIYCERVDASLWGEPVNALTNLAFLLAALVVFRRFRGAPPPLGRALVLALVAIGVGSGLWHTYAVPLTALLDTGAIAVFVLIYIFAVNRHVLGFSRLLAWAALALFFPYAALAGAAFAALPGFAISAPYWPIAFLIAIYSAVLWRRRPAFARGLLAGVSILVVSLVARSVDTGVCPSFPLGTHFLWHSLNALMLGWMVEIYARAMERGPAGPNALAAGSQQG